MPNHGHTCARSPLSALKIIIKACGMVPDGLFPIIYAPENPETPSHPLIYAAISAMGWTAGCNTLAPNKRHIYPPVAFLSLAALETMVL